MADQQKHALLIGINQYQHFDDLEGARNDILETFDLLLDRFGFPNDSDFVDLMVDSPINRDDVVNGLERLVNRVKENDIVLVYYSGHGSQLVHEGQSIEALVPSDSGHGPDQVNRDVFDVEIRSGIERLNRVTPFVTLIFDCCHAGSMTRDPFTTGTRNVAPDQRSPESMFPPGRIPEAIMAKGLQDRARLLSQTADGLLRDGRRALVLSACRAGEDAEEYKVTTTGRSYMQGVFSHFLCRALSNPPKRATWRGIFETVASQVTAVYSSQHPQIEGPWDMELFGVEEHAPKPYLRIKAVDGDVLTLAGGAALGVVEGAIWGLYPTHTTHPSDEAELARLVVETVVPGASRARLDGPPQSPPEVGQRAFLVQQRAERPGQSVCIYTDGASDRDRQSLTRAIERSPLLELVEEKRDGDFAIYRLTPRSTEEGKAMPCPLLRDLHEPAWAAVAKDGHLVATLRREEPGAVQRLVDDLEKVARYRGLMRIDSPKAGNPLVDRVDFNILRWRVGAMVEAEANTGDGLPRFGWGEGLEVEIVNRYDRPIWLTLLSFGCDFSIGSLLPDSRHPDYQPGGYRLEPGATLRIVRDYHPAFLQAQEGSTLVLTQPEGFPWEAQEGYGDVEAVEHLRLMVTDAPADFSFLHQKHTRDPGAQNHPLLELSRLYACGAGTRDAYGVAGDELAWSVLHRSLIIGLPR